MKMTLKLKEYKETNQHMFLNKTPYLNNILLAQFSYMLITNSNCNSVDESTDHIIEELEGLCRILYNPNANQLLQLELFFILSELCKNLQDISLLELGHLIRNKQRDGWVIDVIPHHNTFEDYLCVETSQLLIYTFIFWVRSYKEGFTRNRFILSNFPQVFNRDGTFTFEDV
jgi:hypothetical protein